MALRLHRVFHCIRFKVNKVGIKRYPFFCAFLCGSWTFSAGLKLVVVPFGAPLSLICAFLVMAQSWFLQASASVGFEAKSARRLEISAVLVENSKRLANFWHSRSDVFRQTVGL